MGIKQIKKVIEKFFIMGGKIKKICHNVAQLLHNIKQTRVERQNEIPRVAVMLWKLPALSITSWTVS